MTFRQLFAKSTIAYAAALLALSSAQAQIPCRYEISPTIIQAPPCAFTGPPGISAFCVTPSGRYISGKYAQCDTGDKAYFYDTTLNQLTTLPFPSGVISMSAEAVNDMGLVAGTWVRPIGMQQRSRGFVYTIATGQFVELLPLNAGGDCVVNGMNSSGQVCGTRSIGSPNDPTNPKTAFIWQNGFTDLGLINNATTAAYSLNDTGWVAGTQNSDGSAFLWNGSRLIQIGSLAGMLTVPHAVNNNLQVVGRSAVPAAGFPAGVAHAFSWTNGRITDLGTLPGDNASSATRIADLGTIFASSFSTSTFVLTPCLRVGMGLRPLTDFIEPFPRIAAVTSIGGFRADGGMIGIATDSTSHDAVVILNPSQVAVGDTNADCLTNIDDLVLVITQWGQTDSLADLNHDRMVNIDDLVIVITHWTLR